MYDELVKRLREAAKMSEALAVLLPHSEGNTTAKLFNEAADAIEELQAHYCPHMIRNVHDRGDDSLCRVLRTEPPKEQWICADLDTIIDCYSELPKEE